MHRQVLTFNTPGRGFIDITRAVDGVCRESGVQLGLCHAFLKHTSASLILCENADPTVRDDLAAFFARLVPDGDRLFRHTAEGPDDMPAHVRTILTQNALSIPVDGGHLSMGTWQGLYLWEHRAQPHARRLTLTIVG